MNRMGRCLLRSEFLLLLKRRTKKKEIDTRKNIFQPVPNAEAPLHKDENGYIHNLLSPESATLPFVISTGA
jgi:hypothetical protein